MRNSGAGLGATSAFGLRGAFAALSFAFTSTGLGALATAIACRPLHSAVIIAMPKTSFLFIIAASFSASCSPRCSAASSLCAVAVLVVLSCVFARSSARIAPFICVPVVTTGDGTGGASSSLVLIIWGGDRNP